MKVLGICGSPRKESSSTYLVEKIVKTAVENGNDGTVHHIRNLNISQCNACDYCGEGKGCKLDDAMTDIYEEIYDADVLVVGSPIYYGEVSAQTKTFIDRLYQFSMNPNRKIKDKKAIQVYTQGEAEELYTSYFDYQKNNTYELLGFEVSDIFPALGIMTKEELLEKQDILDKAVEISKSI
jgi:multimeric flavodoxin WrbA